MCKNLVAIIQCMFSTLFLIKWTWRIIFINLHFYHQYDKQQYLPKLFFTRTFWYEKYDTELYIYEQVLITVMFYKCDLPFVSIF